MAAEVTSLMNVEEMEQSLISSTKVNFYWICLGRWSTEYEAFTYLGARYMFANGILRKANFQAESGPWICLGYLENG